MTDLTAPGETATARGAGLVLALRVAQVLLGLSVAGLLVAALVLPQLLDTTPVNCVTEPCPGAVRPLQIGFALLSSAVVAAAWFWVVRMLIQVVRTVQGGDPFQDANVGRLRSIWIVIALAELFRMVAHAFASTSLVGGEWVQAETGLDIRIGTWFLVLVIAALSEAFRHGAEMRREQELTI